MGTKRKIAVWRQEGKVYRAKPPDWPKSTEYSCTDQSTLIAWAQNHGYILKDGNPRRGNNERHQARSARHDLAAV